VPPEISRFHGIVVSVNFNDHPPPHVHVRRGGEEGRIGLDPVVDLDGTLSATTRKRVLAWATAHRFELMANWYLAQAHKDPLPVPPPPE